MHACSSMGVAKKGSNVICVELVTRPLTKGSLFYRRSTPPTQILETLALLADGVRISYLLEDVVYNFCRFHKSLRLEVTELDRRWNKRTPAMAAAITQQPSTLEGLFSLIPLPTNS